MATAHVQDGSVVGVTLENVDSFLLIGDATVTTASLGPMQVDIAYGGDFYAIVDADSIGLDLSPADEAAAAAVAGEIITAVNEQLPVAHPDNPSINRCYETMFTTGAVLSGDVRHVVVSPPGAFDRSPCGTGSSARLATMYARKQVAVGQRVRFEGLLGTYLTGEIGSVREHAGRIVVRPRITGRAYLTGFHTFVLDRDDPFPMGYRIGPTARPQ